MKDKWETLRDEIVEMHYTNLDDDKIRQTTRFLLNFMNRLEEESNA